MKTQTMKTQTMKTRTKTKAQKEKELKSLAASIAKFCHSLARLPIPEQDDFLRTVRNLPLYERYRWVLPGKGSLNLEAQHVPLAIRALEAARYVWVGRLLLARSTAS